MLFVTLPLCGQETSDAAAEAAPNKKLIKVFTIANGDAGELKNVIEELFRRTDEAHSAVDAKTALLQLQFSVDARTNSIIAAGPKGDLQVIEDLLFRLDCKSPQQQQPAQRKTSVYRLQNAPAEDVAFAINQWLEERSPTEAGVDPAADNAASSARRQPIVVPELVSNSLIVSTTFEGDQAKELDELIRALDTRPDMIKIKMLLKKTVDGKETVLCQPHMVTVDQQVAKVTIGSGDASYTIELTPYVISGGKPTEVTEIPTQTKNR